MAAKHETVKVDAKELKNAEQMWANFVTGGKYAIYGTVIILVGLALAFVKFF